jgi:Zn-dependent peptidase ImmA (M78 family)
VQPVSYRGRLVAGVAAEEVVLSSQIAELEDDHPHRRFVLAMCKFAAEGVRSQRPYGDAAAERFARTLLMPEPAWRRAAGYSDLELAEAFNVPFEQVRRRRSELARAGWWQLAPEAV